MFNEFLYGVWEMAKDSVYNSNIRSFALDYLKKAVNDDLFRKFDCLSLAKDNDDKLIGARVYTWVLERLHYSHIGGNSLEFYSSDFDKRFIGTSEKDFIKATSKLHAIPVRDATINSLGYLNNDIKYTISSHVLLDENRSFSESQHNPGEIVTVREELSHSQKLFKDALSNITSDINSLSQSQNESDIKLKSDIKSYIMDNADSALMKAVIKDVISTNIGRSLGLGDGSHAGMEIPEKIILFQTKILENLKTKFRDESAKLNIINNNRKNLISQLTKLANHKNQLKNEIKIVLLNKIKIAGTDSNSKKSNISEYGEYAQYVEEVEQDVKDLKGEFFDDLVKTLKDKLSINHKKCTKIFEQILAKDLEYANKRAEVRLLNEQIKIEEQIMQKEKRASERYEKRKTEAKLKVIEEAELQAEKEEKARIKAKKVKEEKQKAEKVKEEKRKEEAKKMEAEKVKIEEYKEICTTALHLFGDYKSIVRGVNSLSEGITAKKLIKSDGIVKTIASVGHVSASVGLTALTGDVTPLINTAVFNLNEHTNVLKSDNAIIQCGMDVFSATISSLVTLNLLGAGIGGGIAVSKCGARAIFGERHAVVHLFDAALGINEVVNGSNLVIKLVEGLKSVQSFSDAVYTAVDTNSPELLQQINANHIDHAHYWINV